MAVHGVLRGRVATNDDGSAVVFMVLVLAVVSVAVAVLILTASATRARAEAQSVADAVAIAATYDGSSAAERLAVDNRSIVVSLRENEDGYTVVVLHGRVYATARASRTQCPESCLAIP